MIRANCKHFQIYILSQQCEVTIMTRLWNIFLAFCNFVEICSHFKILEITINHIEV